ncbi:MAG: hypothetical protein AB1813_20640 [Verrucomicrobiota bacterium]|jgi:hypothetical protein
MASKPKLYRRLPGRGHRLNFITTLWEAADHLLLVESTRFSERYLRFYFSDIQWITIRRTNQGKMINIFTGFFGGACLLLAVATTDVARVIWIALAFPLLLILLLNAIAGPTCVCHVRTGVQVAELASLVRVRAARKMLARIRPKIAAAQGPMPALGALPVAEAAPDQASSGAPLPAINPEQTSGSPVEQPPVISGSEPQNPSAS